MAITRADLLSDAYRGALANLSPFAQSALRQSQQRRRGGRPKEYTPPKEALMQQIGGMGTSALGGVAGTLDLAGGNVRQLLAGRMPNVSIDPHSKITGRELLEQYGLLGPNKEGFWASITDPADFAGDIAGLATEVVTDPLLFLRPFSMLSKTGAALSKGGQVAERAGLLKQLPEVLERAGGQMGKREALQSMTLRDLIRQTPTPARPATQVAEGITEGLGFPGAREAVRAARAEGLKLRDIADEPLGGFLGYGNPFKQPAGVFSSPTAGRAADLGLGAISKSPVGNVARGLFDPASGGMFAPLAQRVAQLTARGLPQADREAMRLKLKAAKEIDETFQAFHDSFGDIARGADPSKGPATLPNVPFEVGDVVRSGQDFGMVTGLDPGDASVFMRNPAGGMGAELSIPYSQLEKATPEVAESLGDFAYDISNQALHRIVRLAGESKDVDGAFRQVLGVDRVGIPNELREKVAGIAQDMQVSNLAIYESARNKGMKGSLLEETVDFAHMPRQLNPFIGKQLGKFFKKRVLPTSFFGAKGRDDEVRYLYTEVIEKMLRDKDTVGANAAEHIAREYGQFLDVPDGQTLEGVAGNLSEWLRTHRMNADFDVASHFNNPELYAQQIGSLKRNAAKALKSTKDEPNAGVNYIIEEYGRFLKGPPEQAARDIQAALRLEKSKVPLYDPDLIETYHKYQAGAQKADKALDAIHHMYRDNIDPTRGIKLEDALQRASMDTERGTEYFAKLMGVSADEAKGLRIAPEAVDAANAYMKAYTQPEWATGIGKAIDSFLRMFKNNVTVPFPAFWARNHNSGQFVNISSGLVEGMGDLKNYGSAYREALRMLNGKGDQALLNEMKEMGVIGQARGFMDVNLPTEAIPTSPFKVGQHRLSAMAELDPSRADVIPGMRGLRTAHKTWMNIGSAASGRVEFMNRAPMYAYLRKKGWEPMRAAEKVKELQVDYAALTPFEKKVMKRAAPFYSFTRRITPPLVNNILEQPGGALAQTIKQQGKLSGDPSLLPEYLSQQTAIPISEDEEGTKRFLSGLGLSHEDPLSFVGSPSDILLEGLSRANPLAKGVIEAATGESLFQRGPMGGRRLEDMDPPIGRTLSNILGLEDPVNVPGERALGPILSNTPLTRYMTTARTMTDPRKRDLGGVMNLLSGLKVTDLSPEAARRALSERIQAEFVDDPQGRVMQKAYIPSDVIEGLPPGERRDRIQALKQLQLLLDRERRAER